MTASELVAGEVEGVRAATERLDHDIAAQIAVGIEQVVSSPEFPYKKSSPAPPSSESLFTPPNKVVARRALECDRAGLNAFKGIVARPPVSVAVSIK